MSLKKDFYFLSPVEVVKVTSQNLQEVAEWCGGQVATTESRRVPGRMDSYIWVPTPKGTQISWAFPGMFITKRLVRTVKDELRITYAVFRRDYFEKNYFESPGDAVAQTWEKGNSKKVKHPKHPEMAGKPKDLELNVKVPPGTKPEEIEKAVEEAVEILQEQGVLKATEPVIQGPAAGQVAASKGTHPTGETTEDEALKAIANAPEFENFKKNEEAQALSPREVHDAQVEGVTNDPEVTQG